MTKHKALIIKKNGHYGSFELDFTHKKSDYSLELSLKINDKDLLTYGEDISELHIEEGDYTIAKIKFI